MSQGQLSEVEELFCGAERGMHGRQGVRGESCRQRRWAHCAASAVVGCGREQGDRAGWSWRGLVLISCLQGQSCVRMFMCMYVCVCVCEQWGYVLYIVYAMYVCVYVGSGCDVYGICVCVVYMYVRLCVCMKCGYMCYTCVYVMNICEHVTNMWGLGVYVYSIRVYMYVC